MSLAFANLILYQYQKLASIAFSPLWVAHYKIYTCCLVEDCKRKSKRNEKKVLTITDKEHRINFILDVRWGSL